MDMSPPNIASNAVASVNGEAHPFSRVYVHEVEYVMRVAVPGAAREAVKFFGAQHKTRLSPIGSVSVPKTMLFDGWRWCFLYSSPTGSTITAYARGDAEDLAEWSLELLRHHFGPGAQVFGLAALEEYVVLDDAGATEFARRHADRHDGNLVSKIERKKKRVLCCFRLAVQVGQKDKLPVLAVLYQPKNSKTPNYWKLELRPFPERGAGSIKRFRRGLREAAISSHRRFSPCELRGPMARALLTLVADIPIHDKPSIWDGSEIDDCHPVLTGRDVAVLWAVREQLPTPSWRHVLTPVLGGVRESNERCVLSRTRKRLRDAGLIERTPCDTNTGPFRLTFLGEQALTRSVNSPTNGKLVSRLVICRSRHLSASTYQKSLSTTPPHPLPSVVGESGGAHGVPVPANPESCERLPVQASSPVPQAAVEDPWRDLASLTRAVARLSTRDRAAFLCHPPATNERSSIAQPSEVEAAGEDRHLGLVLQPSEPPSRCDGDARTDLGAEGAASPASRVAGDGLGAGVSAAVVAAPASPPVAPVPSPAITPEDVKWFRLQARFFDAAIREIDLLEHRCCEGAGDGFTITRLRWANMDAATAFDNLRRSQAARVHDRLLCEARLAEAALAAARGNPTEPVAARRATDARAAFRALRAALGLDGLWSDDYFGPEPLGHTGKPPSPPLCRAP
jgi:hypothetical protein